MIGKLLGFGRMHKKKKLNENFLFFLSFGGN
jgi:hypothetical protein